MKEGSRPLVTLGIPTFNRCKTVSKRAKELLTIQLPSDVEVLIIDNASPDGTYETVREILAGSHIRLLQNAKNLGFYGNFVELIRQAKGEYLLWSSDEDVILSENLNELIAFLKANRPYFVAPLYTLPINGKKQIYRGKKSDVKFMPKDVWSVGHLPGLIFKVDQSKAFFQKFEEFLNTYPTIILYYPHTMVAIHLFLQGDCYWWNKAITEQQDFLPQLHQNDRSGAAYYHLKSRWTQWKEFVTFLQDLKQQTDLKSQELIDAILEHHQQRVFHLVRTSIGKESTEALASFDREASRMFGVRQMLKRARKFLLRK